MLEYFVYLICSFIELWGTRIWIQRNPFNKTSHHEESLSILVTDESPTQNEDICRHDNSRDPKINSISTIVRNLATGSSELNCAFIQCQTILSDECIELGKDVLRDAVNAISHLKKSELGYSLANISLQLTRLFLCDMHARHRDFHDHIAFNAWINELRALKSPLLHDMARCVQTEHLEFARVNESGKTPSDPHLDNIVRDKIESLMKRKLKFGTIYVYSSHRAPGKFKVGSTERSAGIRVVEQLRCFPGAELVKTFDVYYPKRLEEILRQEFRSVRFKLKEKCSSCDKVHQEWFEVEQDQLLERIKGWSEIFSEDNLYDEDGIYSPPNKVRDSVENMIRSRPSRPRQEFLTPKKTSRRESYQSFISSNSQLSTPNSGYSNKTQRSLSVSSSGTCPGEQSPSPAPRPSIRVTPSP